MICVYSSRVELTRCFGGVDMFICVETSSGRLQNILSTNRPLRFAPNHGERVHARPISNEGWQLIVWRMDEWIRSTG